MPDPKDSSDDDADSTPTRAVDPPAPAPAQDHHGVLRESAIRGLRMLLGLLILQGLAALLGATAGGARARGR